MSLTRYSGYTANFQHAGGTMALTQWLSQGINPNANKLRIVPAGAVDTSAVLTTSSRPTVSLQTRDLATVLASVSPATGLPCIATSAMWMQKRVDQAIFAGVSSHVKVAAAKGFLVVDSISASGGDDPATLDLMFNALWNGSVNPLVDTYGQTLAGSVPAFTTVYFGGPVYVNSVIVDGIIGTTVSPGIVFDTKVENFEQFPKNGVIIRRDPVITLTLSNMDYANTIGSLLGAAAAGTIAVYYRKGTSNGTRVADATAEHVKVSAATGHIGVDSIDFSGNDDGTLTVTIIPTATLSVSTTSAIP